MFITQYIEEYYPIKDRVQQLVCDPFTLIRESDDLPYDDIRYCDGKLQKVVELEDGTYVPVSDLLMYDKDDVDAMPSDAFRKMYHDYMDQVDVKTITFKEIMSAVNDYKKHKEDIKKKVGMCTN